jgi:acetyl esterase
MITLNQGNLATVTAMQARDIELSPPIASQILIYPVTNCTIDTPSFKKYLRHGLDAKMMSWFWYEQQQPPPPQ